MACGPAAAPWCLPPMPTATAWRSDLPNAASPMSQPGEMPAHVFAAGSVNGAYDLDAALAEGSRAGWAAAGDAGRPASEEPAPPIDKGAVDQTHPWPIFPHGKGKDFVDFD